MTGKQLTIEDIKRLLPQKNSAITLTTSADITTQSGQEIKAGAKVVFAVTNVSHKRGYVGLHFHSLEEAPEKTDNKEKLHG